MDIGKLEALSKALQQLKAEQKQSILPQQLSTKINARKSVGIQNREELERKKQEQAMVLQKQYASRLFWLLVFEIISTFGIIIGSGLGYLNIGEVALSIITTGILAQSFLLVRIIVKSLFK